MPERFFTGTTRAGRVLELFTEGPIFTGGTIDGGPIDVTSINFGGGGAEGPATVTAVTDQGTFTAIAGEDHDAEAHQLALRRYLERRPSEGWEVTLVEHALLGDEWRFQVEVSNGRLTERVGYRMSARLADEWLEEPSDTDLPTLFERYARHELGRKQWGAIADAAAGDGTEIIWATRPSRYP